MINPARCQNSLSRTSMSFGGDHDCFHQLFEQAGDIIFVHGLDGRFRDINGAACSALGYTREELLRMHPWDLVVSNSKESILSVWAGMRTGVSLTINDDLRRKDGTTFPAEIRLVRYVSNGRDLIIAIYRDISKRREAEAAMGRLEAAMVEERNRMTREIHDTLAQSFTGILLQLEAAEAARETGMSVESYYCRAREIAKFGIEEARRSVLALRPLALEEGGLEQALRQLTERSSITGSLNCEFSASGLLQRLDPVVELNLLRITQEAFGNAIKHAKAAHISIDLAFTPQQVRISITDDGKGRGPPSHDWSKTGYGLLAMNERAREIGGTLKIETQTGEGTIVSLVLPHLRSADIDQV